MPPLRPSAQKRGALLARRALVRYRAANVGATQAAAPRVGPICSRRSSAAHIDHNSGNNRRPKPLPALPPAPRSSAARWLTCRCRYALEDLFLGLYAEFSHAAAYPASFLFAL
jgi:hypothetical protein